MNKSRLHKVDLTTPRHLNTLIENRRVFSLHNCELNVFETYQQAYQVPLTFDDFIITSMVRGKKVMHMLNNDFDYLPGETVIVPAREKMLIDFPEATADDPTQCIALAVDASYVKNTLNYLNAYYNTVKDEATDWELLVNQYHFDNDAEVSMLINKLIRICSGNSSSKDIIADLNLKELLIRLVQSQHLQQVSIESAVNNNPSRRHYIINYIREHLTERITVETLTRKAYLSRNLFFKWFKEQFGLSPVDYINKERIKLAKILLKDRTQKLANISAQCGFTDTNYFVRLFKKAEGVTPGRYQQCMG